MRITHGLQMLANVLVLGPDQHAAYRPVGLRLRMDGKIEMILRRAVVRTNRSSKEIRRRAASGQIRHGKFDTAPRSRTAGASMRGRSRLHRLVAKADREAAIIQRRSRAVGDGNLETDLVSPTSTTAAAIWAR